MNTTHLCLDIEGGIRNAKDLKGCITVDGHRLDTVAEIRTFLREQLALGRRVLPMGDCDNFDYHIGCKGHREGAADMAQINLREEQGMAEKGRPDKAEPSEVGLNENWTCRR